MVYKKHENDLRLWLIFMNMNKIKIIKNKMLVCMNKYHLWLIIEDKVHILYIWFRIYKNNDMTKIINNLDPIDYFLLIIREFLAYSLWLCFIHVIFD